MVKKYSVVLCIALFCGLFVLCTTNRQIAARTQEVYDHLKTFSDALAIIQNNYVDEIDIKNAIYNAIKGMTASLDPHSAFMPPDLYREMQVETKGSFGGIGIEIIVKDEVLTVVAPIEDTPAFHAGIKTGDKIIKINDEPTKNMTLFDAVKKMRGKPGTAVKLTIVREGVKEPRTLSIVRDIIKIKSVKHKVLEDAFGYIRIAQFQESTAEDFSKAWKDITAHISSPRGLVLDLRSNPGGLLDQAVKIADWFLDAGLIVYTEGRTENQKMQFYAHPDNEIIACPVVVLVNSGSASAAEIVAGALQDYDKAIIVGTQTFGKGTVQTIFPLSDGSGLRITTAKYYTPHHRSIQEKGISPDIVVEDADNRTATGKKSKQFREKDLINHFKGTETAEPDNETGEVFYEQRPGERHVAEDKQLQSALTVLRNWETFKKSLGKQ
ncbi:MAG: S41 family peptidase [Desulfobacterota bacterium]|nr:S41 family peptidase [Thermodesulfobacteriota bacterium]